MALLFGPRKELPICLGLQNGVFRNCISKVPGEIVLPATMSKAKYPSLANTEVNLIKDGILPDTVEIFLMRNKLAAYKLLTEP